MHTNFGPERAASSVLAEVLVLVVNFSTQVISPQYLSVFTYYGVEVPYRLGYFLIKSICFDQKYTSHFITFLQIVELLRHFVMVLTDTSIFN